MSRLLGPIKIRLLFKKHPIMQKIRELVIVSNYILPKHIIIYQFVRIELKSLVTIQPIVEAKVSVTSFA
jgi:hypothetical protein